jgi:hypothetical protein
MHTSPKTIVITDFADCEWNWRKKLAGTGTWQPKKDIGLGKEKEKYTTYKTE